MPPHASETSSSTVFENWKNDLFCYGDKPLLPEPTAPWHQNGSQSPQSGLAIMPQCLPRSTLEHFRSAAAASSINQHQHKHYQHHHASPSVSQSHSRDDSMGTSRSSSPTSPLEENLPVMALELEQAAASPSTTRRTKKKKKSLSFYPEVEIYTIPHRDELPKEALYLSRDEMATIHCEAWEIVDLMNCGIDYEDSSGFSKRGLVDLKDDPVEKRRVHRDQIYKIVLGVQEFGRGKLDVTTVIADMYRKASANSQLEAYQIAHQDAKAAGMVAPPTSCTSSSSRRLRKARQSYPFCKTNY